nr:hypothetical protein [Tanacetum cinerariifolium]
MTYIEARNHLRRMWNKFRYLDLIKNERGVFFFKFQDEKVMEEVVNNGPWLVNNKPIFMQKWRSVKGISALASSLGKPIIMDEFTDELALITYPPDYDDNLKCDIESDLREIEFLLYQGKDSDFKYSIDQSDLANLDDLFVDPTPEMFTDEQPPDYLFPPRFDVYPDDFLEIESDANNFDDDLFDSKGEKIKEFELLIDQLDLPCDILS